MNQDIQRQNRLSCLASRVSRTATSPFSVGWSQKIVDVVHIMRREVILLKLYSSCGAPVLSENVQRVDMTAHQLDLRRPCCMHRHCKMDVV